MPVIPPIITQTENRYKKTIKSLKTKQQRLRNRTSRALSFNG